MMAETTESTELVQLSLIRRIIRNVFKFLIGIVFAVLTDMKITGKENLPDSGPLMLVGNHFHFADALAFIHIAPWPIEFIGNKAMPNAPASVRILALLWGPLMIKRGTSSRDSLVAATKLIEQGGVLGIFPEAGSWARVLRPPRPGTALLALRTGAPLVPVGLVNFNEIFPSLRTFKRARIEVNIGEPFGPYEGQASGRADRQLMDDVGHDIMRHIAALIPPKDHGVYSEDPAVREAAKEAAIYPWDIA
jgi:1-acyl-sn-glycerol-3-phosphate acyltransferase